MNKSDRFQEYYSDDIFESKDFGYFQVQDKKNYGWFVYCPDAVVVAPIKFVMLSDTEKAVQLGLIKIFRHPIGQTAWEFPGGAVEKDETPDKAAMRELFEETNISASNVENIGMFYAAPGRMYFPHHVFITKDIKHQVKKNQAYQEMEHISDLSFFSLDNVSRMVFSGEIVSSATISALNLIQIWRSRL